MTFVSESMLIEMCLLTIFVFEWSAKKRMECVGACPLRYSITLQPLYMHSSTQKGRLQDGQSQFISTIAFIQSSSGWKCCISCVQPQPHTVYSAVSCQWDGNLIQIIVALCSVQTTRAPCYAIAEIKLSCCVALASSSCKVHLWCSCSYGVPLSVYAAGLLFVKFGYPVSH